MKKAQFDAIINDPKNAQHVQKLRGDAAVQGVQEYQLYIFSLSRWKRCRYILNTLLIRKQKGSKNK